MISKRKCVIIFLLCISFIPILHSLPNDEQQENQDKQKSNQSENKSCEVPPPSQKGTVNLFCMENSPQTCIPSNGYVPEGVVAKVTCPRYYQQENRSNGTHVCRNKQWVPPVTKCVKKGTCRQPEEICVKEKQCINGSELKKLGTYKCGLHIDKKTITAGVCCKNATAVALNYCKQYVRHKYVSLRKDPDIPGESEEWLNSTDCANAETLIVGGHLTVPKEYPHMALIGYGTTFKDVSWECGGSLISEKFILSAAHCITLSLNGQPKWVLLGDLNIRSESDDARPAVYSIAKIHKHPHYNPTTKNNDIAIFELNTSVVLSPYVRPGCLYTQTSKPIGIQGSITGWGRTDTVKQLSDHLLKATIEVYDDSQCETKFKQRYNSTTRICAGDLRSGKDTCVGDSGGPLQLPNEEDCMWDIMGITSFGDGICGNRGVPSVYTNVAYYLDWIQNIVWP